jgi:hypothetical protein
MRRVPLDYREQRVSAEIPERPSTDYLECQENKEN